jgi:hypothetical protein
MFFKIHKSYRDVIAICDKEIMGRKFEEGKFQLDVKESFFLGKEAEEKEILEVMRKMSLEDATFNIVGKKSVAAALKAGIITEEGIKKIQGVPLALVLL